MLGPCSRVEVPFVVSHDEHRWIDLWSAGLGGIVKVISAREGGGAPFGGLLEAER